MILIIITEGNAEEEDQYKSQVLNTLRRVQHCYKSLCPFDPYI